VSVSLSGAPGSPHDHVHRPLVRIKLEVQDAIRGPWGAAESERRSEDGWR
jgi:hypothetical protein